MAAATAATSTHSLDVLKAKAAMAFRDALKLGTDTKIDMRVLESPGMGLEGVFFELNSSDRRFLCILGKTAMLQWYGGYVAIKVVSGHGIIHKLNDIFYEPWCMDVQEGCILTVNGVSSDQYIRLECVCGTALVVELTYPHAPDKDAELRFFTMARPVYSNLVKDIICSIEHTDLVSWDIKDTATAAEAIQKTLDAAAAAECAPAGQPPAKRPRVE